MFWNCFRILDLAAMSNSLWLIVESGIRTVSVLTVSKNYYSLCLKIEVYSRFTRSQFLNFD